MPVTEPDVADNDDDEADDEAAAAPLEVADDVPAQEAIVGTVTPTLFSSDSTSVYVSLSEIPSYKNQFLSFPFHHCLFVCVCVVLRCEGMRLRRRRGKKKKGPN